MTISINRDSGLFLKSAAIVKNNQLTSQAYYITDHVAIDSVNLTIKMIWDGLKESKNLKNILLNIENRYIQNLKENLLNEKKKVNSLSQRITSFKQCIKFEKLEYFRTYCLMNHLLEGTLSKSDKEILLVCNIDSLFKALEKKISIPINEKLPVEHLINQVPNLKSLTEVVLVNNIDKYDEKDTFTAKMLKLTLEADL